MASSYASAAISPAVICDPSAFFATESLFGNKFTLNLMYVENGSRNPLLYILNLTTSLGLAYCTLDVGTNLTSLTIFSIVSGFTSA